MDSNAPQATGDSNTGLYNYQHPYYIAMVETLKNRIKDGLINLDDKTHIATLPT